MKWQIEDSESSLAFSITKADSGKLILDCRYNRIKVDIRHYEFSIDTLSKLQLLINSVLADINPRLRKLPHEV